MAYGKKQETNESGWKAVKGMEGFTVIGSRDRFSISFQPDEDLRVQINGCRIVSGKNGDFISYPSWKDKDGNYHNNCYFHFTAEAQKLVMDALD